MAFAQVHVSRALGSQNVRCPILLKPCLLAGMGSPKPWDLWGLYAVSKCKTTCQEQVKLLMNDHKHQKETNMFQRTILLAHLSGPFSHKWLDSFGSSCCIKLLLPSNITNQTVRTRKAKHLGNCEPIECQFNMLWVYLKQATTPTSLKPAPDFSPTTPRSTSYLVFQCVPSMHPSANADHPSNQYTFRSCTCMCLCDQLCQTLL